MLTLPTSVNVVAEPRASGTTAPGSMAATPRKISYYDPGRVSVGVHPDHVQGVEVIQRIQGAQRMDVEEPDAEMTSEFRTPSEGTARTPTPWGTPRASDELMSAGRPGPPSVAHATQQLMQGLTEERRMDVEIRKARQAEDEGTTYLAPASGAGGQPTLPSLSLDSMET